MNITNKSDIPLSLAVWLMHDEYDYVNEPNYVSVTKLMKPLRHIILPSRVPSEALTADLEDFISRAMGHSLHDSIEKAWIRGYKRNLAKLGYPPDVIARVQVNPKPEDLKEDSIPVYLEQRSFRKVTVMGQEFTIGGKYDMVAEGIIHDNKSTTAYTWLYGTKDEDYRLQGSLYRWLNPDKITEDFIRICFIFTDWQKSQAVQNPNYPQSRLLYKEIPLMSLSETEAWVKHKLSLYLRYKDADEKDIPECTNEELWMSDPQYKYYADPTKTSGRSTKNFTDANEAKVYIMEKGGKGVLITVPGIAKRCSYCDAFPVCSQKEKLSHA